MFGAGLAKGLKYTLGGLAKKKVTYDYPEETLQMPDRFLGIQKFYPEKCIVCNKCVNICPTDCITLSGKPNPDPISVGKLLRRMTLVSKFASFATFAQRYVRRKPL